MTRRPHTLDILIVIVILVASFVQATWAPINWDSTTNSAWAPAASSTVELFNSDAVLDTSQVVGLGDTVTTKAGKHAARPDWDEAMRKCQATGEWTSEECHEAVGNGEF